MDKLKTFTENGTVLAVTYVETQQVKDGVECDIYTFDNDNTRDLAIVKVMKGSTTPLQRIIQGDTTIEGYMSGKGALTADGKVHVFPNDTYSELVLKTGQTMQWHATEELTFYEIYSPPFIEGRFKNLD